MRALLFVTFVVVPIVEIFIIVQVGQVIGPWWTVALLIAVSVAGAYLVKREGKSAWDRFRGALGSTRVPAVEVIDGALVLVGGTLLLTPGFMSDIVGLLLIVPPTRALLNRFIRARVRGRFGLVGMTGAGMGGGRPGSGVRRDDPATIDVEVIDIQRNGAGPGER
jgi:UPF0716 protein FxsA